MKQFTCDSNPQKWETKTSEMSQSCQSDFDFSEVEGDDYSELDFGYGGDGKVLPREFAMLGGAGMAQW